MDGCNSSKTTNRHSEENAEEVTVTGEAISMEDDVNHNPLALNVQHVIGNREQNRERGLYGP